ncbi:MAG TPA: hypothetical protein HA232_01320 [Methanocellales archaeon]|nr:hypothetical protein [Methanocellales archaeon]
MALSEPTDKGWFLQLMATYSYPDNPTSSMNSQLKAHTENARLFRPETGISYSKLEAATSRASRILDLIRSKDSPNSVYIYIINVLDKIAFNLPSHLFEEGIDELGFILGLEAQRPEKVYGEGPDNLWHITDKSYWVIEADKAPEPAFLKGDRGKEFHVRVGNTTHQLDSKETVRYIQMNWE